jgi:hypothetical protein
MARRLQLKLCPSERDMVDRGATGALHRRGEMRAQRVADPAALLGPRQRCPPDRPALGMNLGTAAVAAPDRVSWNAMAGA